MFDSAAVVLTPYLSINDGCFPTADWNRPFTVFAMNTVFVAALREGDGFWPGHRAALLQAATVLVNETSVLICTTDGPA